jgi:hypothetical protein
MLEDTKGVFRSRKSKIPKGVIRNPNSKKDKNDKRTHNVLQNTVQKTMEIEQQKPH